MKNNMSRIYTVGHSNGSLEEFYELLRLANINCIIDVRSMPASSYSPHFNKEPLSLFLKAHNVVYLHFGEEFGARRTDSIVDGQVNFEKAVTTTKFLRGYDRVLNGLEQGWNIALMCSEANPVSCHRFSMISRYFYDNGIDVQHILHSKEVRGHLELEQEMIQGMLSKRNSKLPEVDLMFMTYSEEDQRRDAYRIKNLEIGYKPGENQEFEH
jgi:uncharacterized protein (DUF488 family)